MNEAQPGSAPRRSWPLFTIGGLLFLLGPAVNFAQLQQGYLEWTPWYVPVLATVGALLMLASLRHRRSVLRVVGVTFFVLLCGAEWAILGVLTRTPAYDGPATVGNKLPAFAASFADGRSFTNHDLEASKPTVLVFYRDRW